MRPRRLDFAVFVAALVVSFGGHVIVIGGLGSAARNEPRERFRNLELAVIEPPPPPPEVPPPPEPEKKKKPPPPPPPVEPIELPKIVDTAPPPNTSEPPKDNKPAKPVFGISMSSVVGPGSGSGFSVRVGNTLMVQPDEELTAPEEVKPLRPKPVSLHQVSKMPKRIGDCLIDYPSEAKTMGIEGRVRLEVEVRADGTVGNVRLIKGLGYGLDEAAIHALERCRFEPAMMGGQPVPTRIPYVYTFVIED